jgi:hypothetical protein
MLFMSWVILSGPGRPLVQLTPSNQSAPGGRCIPCEPGGPCLPSPIFNLQNSTKLTKKPSNGPVLHSYFLSSVGDLLYYRHSSSSC